MQTEKYAGTSAYCLCYQLQVFIIDTVFKVGLERVCTAILCTVSHIYLSICIILFFKLCFLYQSHLLKYKQLPDVKEYNIMTPAIYNLLALATNNNHREIGL